MPDNFLIFKVTDKKSEKSPDYRICIKGQVNLEEWGAGWIKTSPKGTKYISCAKNKPYEGHK